MTSETPTLEELGLSEVLRIQTGPSGAAWAGWGLLAAAVLGWIALRSHAAVPTSVAGEEDSDVVLGDSPDEGHGATGIGRTIRVLVIGLAVWWVPLLVLIAIRGLDDTLSKLALFFSQMAMVTFGGAYAVLSYINQAAVQTFGWLEPGQMVTGLGLAESTPGPLIMVTEFVGFLAAYRFPGGLDPVGAGIIGAVVTVWATFAPCFLWIFMGAPFIERLRGNVALSSALMGITAAVVGVILNLAVTFAAAMFGRLRSLPRTFVGAIILGLVLLIPPFTEVLAAFADVVGTSRFRTAVLVTFEPGDTPVGQHIRRIVLDPATGATPTRIIVCPATCAIPAMSGQGSSRYSSTPSRAWPTSIEVPTVQAAFGSRRNGWSATGATALSVGGQQSRSCLSACRRRSGTAGGCGTGRTSAGRSAGGSAPGPCRPAPCAWPARARSAPLRAAPPGASPPSSHRRRTG